LIGISKDIVMFNPVEQFLFKVVKDYLKVDDYNDVHRFQFDLETTGLFAKRDSVFQVGVRDNRGMEHVLEVVGDNGIEKDNLNEKQLINFLG
jgi:uncharacterized protein YprB with RNaseH-like and TPR domain